MVSFDEKDRFAIARSDMVRIDLKGRDITDTAVIEVISSIPREEFLSETYLSQAYSDQPLPIGMGQTISQPYIVALMTQCLGLDKKCDVLEIGTGSGYQTAVVAKLAAKVYTVERYNQLSEMAQTVLARLGINNVEYYIGDGSCGWPEKRQFDRIIITAAVPEIPQQLTDQLKDHGLIVAPVGGQFSQELRVCKKTADKLQCKYVCGCRFVKLVGKYGFGEED